MAGHEWDDWFEREEFIGQISDIRVQNLQAEREGIQKRTFTRWMNLHLEKCNPPMVITDLFNEIRDGRVLMALLEELSGCKLLHGFKPSSHRIFRINNIAKVLAFLEERNVKLISIDAADVADGNSSLVLGLIWNIILFFQIKELTGTIQSRFSSTSSLSSLPNSTDSDTSHPGTPAEERAPSLPHRQHGKAIRTLLQWVQRRTAKYGVVVQDFGRSWTTGLAFLAVIKSIDSSLVDMRKARLRTPRQNIEDAFRIAHYSLGIARLLEPEDVMISTPDEQSIITYVAQFLEHFPGYNQEVSVDAEGNNWSSSATTRTDHVAVNGVRRERPRPRIVRKESVPPPPKIFISSVPDNSEQTSPADESAPRNAHIDDRESPVSRKVPERPLDLGKEAEPVSPQPSTVDSAIDSPDSWSEMTSETPLLDSPGLSNDSTCPVSPVGETTGFEATGHEPSALETVKEDSVLKELFIDEGIISQSSMDSFQTHSKLSLEEEDAFQYILDLNDDKKETETQSEKIQDTLKCSLETSTIIMAQNVETANPSATELPEEQQLIDVLQKMEENRPETKSEDKEIFLSQEKGDTKQLLSQLCEETQKAEILPDSRVGLESGVNETETTRKLNDLITDLPSGADMGLERISQCAEAWGLKQDESCQEQSYPEDQDLPVTHTDMLSEDQHHFEGQCKIWDKIQDKNHKPPQSESEDQDNSEIVDKSQNIDLATKHSEDLNLLEGQEHLRQNSVQDKNQDILSLVDVNPHSGVEDKNQDHDHTFSLYDDLHYAALVYTALEGSEEMDPVEEDELAADGATHSETVSVCKSNELCNSFLDNTSSKSDGSFLPGDGLENIIANAPDTTSPGEKIDDTTISRDMNESTCKDVTAKPDLRGESGECDVGDLGSTYHTDIDNLPENRLADLNGLLESENPPRSWDCSPGREEWQQEARQEQAAGVETGPQRLHNTAGGVEGRSGGAEASYPCARIKASGECAEATPRSKRRCSVSPVPPCGESAAELRLLLLLWFLLYCVFVLPQMDPHALLRLLLFNLEE